MKKSYNVIIGSIARLLMCRMTGLVFTLIMAWRASASPQMFCPVRLVDYGLIEPLSTVTNAVAISNAGESPLEIHRVRAGRDEGRSLSIQ